MKKLVIQATVILWGIVLCTLLYSDTVELKDGSKISGEVIIQKDQYRINTPHGTLVVKKDQVKAIYPETGDETTGKREDLLKEIETLVAEMKELKGEDEMVETIDKTIERLYLLREIYKGRETGDINKGDGKACPNKAKSEAQKKEGKEKKVVDPAGIEFGTTDGNGVKTRTKLDTPRLPR